MDPYRFDIEALELHPSQQGRLIGHMPPKNCDRSGRYFLFSQHTTCEHGASPLRGTLSSIGTILHSQDRFLIALAFHIKTSPPHQPCFITPQFHRIRPLQVTAVWT